MKKLMIIICLISIITISCDKENEEDTIYLTISVQVQDINLGYGVPVANAKVGICKNIQSYFSNSIITTGTTDLEGLLKISNSKIKDGDTDLGSSGIGQNGIIYIFAEKDDLNNWAEPKSFSFDDRNEGNTTVSVVKSMAYYLMSTTSWKLKHISVNSNNVTFEDCYQDNSITFNILDGSMIKGIYTEGSNLCVQDLDTSNSYFTIPLSNTIINPPYNEPYSISNNITSYNNDVLGTISGLFLSNDTLEIRSEIIIDAGKQYISRYFSIN